jgi:hypothetical protein
MSPGPLIREPPVYRPFALIALGATILAGTPLGTWMLARLHWGGGPVPAEHVWLHAHLQAFGFFGTLIVGMAQHLVPRFAGRPVADTALARRLPSVIGAALGLRIAGAAAAPLAPLVVTAALLQAVAFGLFAVWVWRALAGPGLAPTRAALGAASGWLCLGLVVETVARGLAALGPDPLAGPDPGAMRAVHAVAIYGGVSGWIVGIVLRAGPMLVAEWRVPDRLVRLAPWSLGLAVGVITVGAGGPWPGHAGVALERAGEALALATVAAIAVTGGAFRRPSGTLPMLGHRGPETRFFRLAMLAAALAGVGSAIAATLGWAGVPLSLLGDALRHLVTVGFLTAMVVGMGFRLLPVVSGGPLRWPRLRGLAFWALLAGVLVRTAEVVADYGATAALSIVPLSGVLVWLALGCLAVNVLAAARRAPRGATRAPGPARPSL